MPILVLFFCSGATALIYEVVWSRYLGLLLGSSVQAQTVVLAAFMGGLALGNRWFGPIADRTPKPLAAYGYLELCIGLYAFAFDALYHVADQAFVAVGTGRLENHAALFGLKLALGVGMLLAPTILMGGTLPLIAGWLQQRYPDASRWSARFYSVNSLGAVAGSALAGFVFLSELGLLSSLQLTGLFNMLVGITAVQLARRQPALEARPKSPAGQTDRLQLTGESRRVFTAACLLVAVTGGVSMGLEVLAARSLVLIVGASLQAFALVLIAFILGIGLGSAAVASPRFSRLPWVPSAALLLLAAAAWVGILVLGLEHWVTAYRYIKSGLNASPMGFRFHQLLIALMSLVVLGIPAAAIGSVLPLCLRALSGTGDLGRSVGRLLTWNTLGAVGGSVLTGFLIMPLAGLRGAFLVLCTLLCTAVVVLAWSMRRRAIAAGAIALVVALFLVAAQTGEGWRHTLSSGVFRTREKVVDPKSLDERRRLVKLLFYEDAVDATVSVERMEMEAGQPPSLGLRVNGKPDASTSTDLCTQFMCAHIPLFYRPEARDVFILGMGSAATLNAALKHPVERVVVAENCEPVLRACELFTPINEGAYTNARARVYLDDGRTVLKLSPHKFDVIINEPSNPWMVGVGGVFSLEFYQLCASRLNEGGLVAQWFHIYETSEDVVRMVLRTFNKVFPHMEIWDCNGGDLVLVGSQSPWSMDPARLAARFADPALKAQLASLGLGRPEALWARQLASQQTAYAIPGPGPLQTDNFPLLEIEAPKAFFIGEPTQFLQRFDERLQKGLIAPPAKLAALASLTDDEIRRVYEKYPATSAGMRTHLQSHGRGVLHPDMCGFRLQSWAASTPDVSQAAPNERPLLEAVGRLRQPDAWEPAAQVILQAVRARKGAAGNAARWSVAAFTRDVVMVALAHGRNDVAREALDAANAVEPPGEELLYLERLLEGRARGR